MAPVPTKSKKQPRQRRPTTVSSDNVVDGFGRSLSSLQRMQSYKERTQDKNTTIARQHAAQNESNNNTLIYRDVFPARKYKLTLSDTSWMGEENVVTVGYTNNETFVELYSTSEAPEDNVFEIEIPAVSAVDTLEIRLKGASSKVRSYIEDNTSIESTWSIINRIVDEISEIATGISNLKERIEALEEAVGIPYSGTDSLDERVSSLENAQ